MERRRRAGVNYVPSENWWYAWHDWTPDSIRRDLDAIVGLGADHIRLHCLWNWFQPNPAMVSSSAMERLGQLLDWSGERGLDVCITLLDGWLSGFDFRPEWLRDAERGIDRSIFCDRAAVEQTAWFVEQVVAQTREHPATWCYDLSNEPNVLVNWNATTEEGAEPWAAELMGRARTLAPGKPVVTGVAHSPWMEDGSGFSRHFCAREMDLAPIHAWPFFTGALPRFGEDRLASWGVADFLVQVARASQRRGDEPVWIQEIGVAQEWLRHTSVEEYAQRMLDRLLQTDADIVTWWCSHDIDRRFTAFAPLEYGLGLLDVHNGVKPAGKVFAAFAEQWRRTPPPAPRTDALVIDPTRAAGLDVLGAWAAASAEGSPWTLVDADRIQDAAYLASRGIEQVHHRPATGGEKS